jgi:uncharacterized FAD-dependent dehydrogenase
MKEKIVIIGAGVAGINAATELVDNGYPGELITIIDKGKDPYQRKPEEVMEGMLGAGGWSDGKLTYHTSIGGQLSKYCGEQEAYELMDKVINNFKRFHPKPEVIMKSDPQSEPDFIQPYFNLRLFPVYHIGSDYLHEIGKRWYDYLKQKGIKFEWETSVSSIRFKNNYGIVTKNRFSQTFNYDVLIFAVGKSGIDFAQELIKEYDLPTEPKSVQIGVRFEAPQKYFQKLIDISYDFKLYQRKDNVSLRSFCTNNNAAYVAVEETYGDISYNGHALKDESKRNDMTNFGILMEIKGIDNPFEWSRDIVKKLNKNYSSKDFLGTPVITRGGLFYSPNRTRKPSLTSEGVRVETLQIDDLSGFKETLGKYADHVIDFIEDMKKVFSMGDDWGMYIPEVKYLSPEPLVDHSDLSLIHYGSVHFVGDALSARGITVSGAQGIYVTKYLLETNK